MALNVKEKPFWLRRENDYPSLLKWVSLQPIIFYDTSSRRAWLVDGASALLQLVRSSLHQDENDPESAYDWVFDPDKLSCDWNGVTGRQGALNTLKSWENLNLNVYVTSKRMVQGQMEVEYATLETRVLKLLHSLEVLIDRQVKVASQDGVTIPQALSFDAYRSVVGFDILDIINPMGAILPRIQSLHTAGHGWKDLVPAMGITTIFGSDFGELICPEKPSTVCPKWRTVPTGLDYLAASMSTMKMLHERRMKRMWPNLGLGEITEKIMWLSTDQAADGRACECLAEPSQPQQTCHLDPVQYLMAKDLRRLRSASRAMVPVDLARVGNKGAVIFGHMSVFKAAGDDDGSKKSGDARGMAKREKKMFRQSSSNPSTIAASGSSVSTLTTSREESTTGPTSSFSQSSTAATSTEPTSAENIGNGHSQQNNKDSGVADSHGGHSKWKRWRYRLKRRHSR